MIDIGYIYSGYLPDESRLFVSIDWYWLCGKNNAINHPPHKNGDDWEIVYYGFTHINRDW